MVETAKMRKLLLICGIIAPLLYVGTDIFAGTLYPGYSFINQYVSELFAIGAPTSSLVVPLLTVYSVFLVAFSLDVWMSAGQNRALRAAALMMTGNAVNGLVLWPFFPMHMRGVEATFTDTMHNALAVVGVIFVLLALVFGAVAYRKRLRFYSIGTILILLVPGIVTFMYGSQVGANQSTPWAGLDERISTCAYLLWVAVLSVVLFRAEKVPGNGHQLRVT
jgi:hypothetical membrane protein